MKKTTRIALVKRDGKRNETRFLIKGKRQRERDSFSKISDNYRAFGREREFPPMAIFLHRREAENASRALQAGKNIFLKKPVTHTAITGFVFSRKSNSKSFEAREAMPSRSVSREMGQQTKIRREYFLSLRFSSSPLSRSEGFFFSFVIMLTGPSCTKLLGVSK